MTVAPSPPLVEHRSVESSLDALQSSALSRVQTAGKFLECAGRKFFIRGVTYGPFEPERDGSEYHTRKVVAADFAEMARRGFNIVRIYTVPPRWLLDEAAKWGLRVMVGLPWEQHVTFLDSRGTRNSILTRVREGVRQCADHPAVLGFVVGNEIPSTIVRWYGRKLVERFILQLYRAAKQEDPEALITYVNYPTTEYLELPFLDFVAFNVFLEHPETLTSYLARLQNLAADKPLILAEIGLDSLRNGLEKQADVLEWQVRAIGAAGCAGTILFSWTDEWFRSGQEITDWNFGLTRNDRSPKPALQVASQALRDLPFRDHSTWPKISIVVCSYNGARTIRQTLTALGNLRYSSFDVFVVDDGSTDDTAQIAAEFPVKVISTENLGLSNARNVGLNEARGEIVAYIDDDAFPDIHWLHYLAHTFATTDFVGTGGPNICPPDVGQVAQCVSHAPGGPNHVLLTDTIAEHIPGCNMAFRRDALMRAGGFDERFRIAGDDVDLCWRLQEQGGKLGFNPAAMVWHHSRGSIRQYLRQQYNYGRAEAMLEDKWPSKYNSAGYPKWQGRVYGPGQREVLRLGRSRVYQGVWGSNYFQSLYTSPPGTIASLSLLPEWYLLTAVLGLVSVAGLAWPPLLWAVPFLLASSGLLAWQAMSAALRADLPGPRKQQWPRWRRRGTIALLHLLQPVARLWGRSSFGLHPWRRRIQPKGFVFPRPRTEMEWCETWKSTEERLEDLDSKLKATRVRTRRGGPFDRWDIEIRGGLFGGLRLLMAIEEHGQEKQLVRVKSWPIVPAWMLPLIFGLSALSLVAIAMKGVPAGIFLGAVLILVAGRAFFDCAAASAVLDQVPSPEKAADPAPHGPEQSEATST